MTTQSPHQEQVSKLSPEIEPLDFCPIMPVFGAPKYGFVSGSGSELFDASQKRYLDLLGGLAVTSLGHCNSELNEVLATQANTLWHVSNLFATNQAAHLAIAISKLMEIPGQVFFTNSGAESNECAIKLARKWGGYGRHEIISAFGSFHGRTLATLHMTGQPAKHEAFQPLPQGFKHAIWDNIDDIERQITPETVAVMVEPIQGEGGVNCPSKQYFKDLRQLCNERNLLLMVDEIQTGLARTGKWFGWQHFLDPNDGPDVVTLAKALGNGMPIGACWAKQSVSAAFKPGDHGSTYSGQPLASAVARKVLEIMVRDDLAETARVKGEYFAAKLSQVDGIDSVRGLGLLLAIELSDKNATQVYETLMDNGFVTNAVSATSLRLAPALTISYPQLDEAVSGIAKAIATTREA